MDITLKPIDESNFIDCFNLQLGDGQDKFVSHPIRSLAQAYVYRDQCQPFGVYADDTMIGYVMVIYDYDEEAYNIWHMMIDKAYQGRGYGKAAMQRVLSYIASKPFGNSNMYHSPAHPIIRLPMACIRGSVSMSPAAAMRTRSSWSCT